MHAAIKATATPALAATLPMMAPRLREPEEAEDAELPVKGAAVLLILDELLVVSALLIIGPEAVAVASGMPELGRVGFGDGRGIDSADARFVGGRAAAIASHIGWLFVEFFGRVDQLAVRVSLQKYLLRMLGNMPEETIGRRA